MRKRLKLAIITGGKSAEHQVALQSARGIVSALDRKKYEITVVGIDREGIWYRCHPDQFLADADDPSRIRLAGCGSRVAIVPGSKGAQLVTLSNRRQTVELDVVFPILHGTFGEDGTLQGLLELCGVAYVGASVLASAIGMDKEIQKRLLREAGLPVGKFIVCRRGERPVAFDRARRLLGLPMFVKPANMGSSVGVSKVRCRREFMAALREAFRHDDKVLVEEFIAGQEIECSVLGNERPIASLPGEVIPNHEFYSYEAKYIDEKGAVLRIPARLPRGMTRKVRRMAIECYRVLGCEGMARVDMFLRGGKEIFVGEINTIPGFTRISMYPKLWEATGLPYSRLLDRLIALALERRRRVAFRRRTF